MGQCIRDEWIGKVASEDGPASPTTRLVLLVLGKHMNRNGGSCFPSVRTLVRETGLSNRCVLDHLALADEDGWITRSRQGRTGRDWKRHTYQAVLPVGGGETGSPRIGGGGEPDDKKVVKEVHHSSSYNQSSLSSTKRGERASPPSRVASEQQFEAAWAAYPKRAGGNPEKAAYRCWRARVRQGASEAELGQGVLRYSRFCDATGKTGSEFVMQASRFFGPDEHWREDWTVPSRNGGVPEAALADLQVMT